MVEEQIERPFYGFVHELECDKYNCETPLRIVAPRKSTMTPEEIKADVSTWEWGELRCPSGYLIPKPQKGREGSL